MKRFFAIAAAVILTVVFLVVSQTKACYEPIFSLISQEEEVEETTEIVTEEAETIVTENETEEAQPVPTTTTDVILPLITTSQTSLETTSNSLCSTITTITISEESEPYTGGTYSVMSGELCADEDVTEDFISGYTVICNSIPDGTIIYIESPTCPDIDNYYQVVNTQNTTQEEIEFFFNREEIPNSFSETKVIIDLYVSIVTNTFHRETISEETGENQEY